MLVVEEGYNRGERLPLPLGEAWVGRAPECAVQLVSDGVSRRHAKLVSSAEADAVEVEDEGSRNGTVVNGVRAARASLRPGDRLKVGDVTLVLRTTSDPLGPGSTLCLEPARPVDAPPAPPEPAPAREPPQVELWGEAPAVRRLLDQVERVARAASPVLVRGETGTGKELVARAIHALSPRRREPFVPVNCALLDGALLESELFGHERGAFTGAAARKLGLVEVAGKGVLFLDEVAELPAGSQAKLLRLLEDGEFRRVGGTTPLRAACQVVAATHRDLDAEVAASRFRADLVYRLRVVELLVPPLRERGDDVDLLAERLLARLAAHAGRRLTLGAPAKAALRAHTWPGNVRELKNVLERAVILAPGATIGPDDLGLRPAAAPATDHFPTLEALEREHIVKALARTDGARAEAAQLLGIDRKTLYRRLRALGLADGEDA